MNWGIILLGAIFCFGLVKSYKIGVGRADCTGPPVEVIFVSIE